MTGDPVPGSVDAIADAYAGHCARVALAIAEQAEMVEALIDAMLSAGAIHCYGFGRSGDAAESLAIRLRHFLRFLPSVWWMDDHVRNPFEPGQLLLAFSRRATRFDLVEQARHARERGLVRALVTSAPGRERRRTDPAGPWDYRIGLPSLDPALLAPASLYGGGDFEVAAYLFQEVLATRIGLRRAIPAGEVDRFHVH